MDFSWVRCFYWWTYSKLGQGASTGGLKLGQGASTGGLSNSKLGQGASTSGLTVSWDKVLLLVDLSWDKVLLLVDLVTVSWVRCFY